MPDDLHYLSLDDVARRLKARKLSSVEATEVMLDRIGVHPTLRMHYQMAIKPEIAEHVTVRDFLPALMKERRHG